MIKRTLLFFILIVFSCQTSEKESKLKSEGLKNQTLGNLMGSIHLELSASFNECGEWGGHNEKFNIYRKNEVLFVNYSKDTTDCKKPYDKNRKIVEQKNLVINEDDEKAILNYLQYLLEIGLKNNLPPSGRSHYSAIMSDSTLILKSPSIKGSLDEYNKLKSKLLK